MLKATDIQSENKVDKLNVNKHLINRKNRHRNTFLVIFAVSFTFRQCSVTSFCQL